MCLNMQLKRLATAHGLPRNAGGSGLIETLAIILFISVSVVALFKFERNISYSTSITQQQADATILAASKLESLLDYQVLTTTSGYNAYSAIVSGTGTSTVGNTTYTLTWTVTTVTSPAYKTLDITVSWNDRYGVGKSIRLITDVDSDDPSVASTFM